MDDLNVDTSGGEFPALVDIRAAETSLVQALQERAPEADAAFLEAHPPFFWRATISNGRVDTYGTRMGRTSLKNYCDDANAGVPFMNSHRTGGLFKGSAELPMGRSLDAKFVTRTNEPHTEATFYTCADLRLGEVSSDDFINGIKSGIVSDVSVGFMRGRFVCDLCGQEAGRSDCDHMPGLYYDVERANEKGKTVTERVLCTATVEDARLGEVSAVFKGSCPGAMIVKAHRLAETHKLGPQQLSLLEDRYRILLPGSPRTYTWATNNANPPAPAGDEADGAAAPQIEAKDTEMGDRVEPTQNDLHVTDLRALLSLKEDDNPLTAVRALLDRAKTAEAEVERMKPLAADGEGYRNDLVAQVVTEGKRAFGEKFNEERQTALFRIAPIETLKETRDAYAELADKQFPKQRVTSDEEGDAEKNDERPRARARSRRAYAA